MFSEVSQNSQENTWARASFLIKLQAKALRSWSWEIHLTRGWFAQCDWWWQEEIYGRAYQWINQEIWATSKTWTLGPGPLTLDPEPEPWKTWNKYRIKKYVWLYGVMFYEDHTQCELLFKNSCTNRYLN